jgi:hypothetical protein
VLYEVLSDLESYRALRGLIFLANIQNSNPGTFKYVILGKWEILSDLPGLPSLISKKDRCLFEDDEMALGLSL